MEGTIESRSVTEIKKILYQYLEDSSLLEASTSKWTPLAFRSWSPHQAQVNASIDEARAEAQYESIVILLSGYGRNMPDSATKTWPEAC